VWLKERGLSLNKEKTRIGRISDGFDFLSFGIRRYRTAQGGKVLTRPSRDAMKKIRRRLADELRVMRGSPVSEVLYALNPVIRGSPGAGELLPDRGVQEVLPVAGRLPVAAALQVGSPQAPQEGPEMGHRPLLRPVLPAQAQLVGLRRPGNRGLPPPVRLDEDRPARAGPRQVHALRSCPGPVLGRPAAQAEAPATGPVLADRPAGPARALPAMPGTAAVRRPRAGLPRPVGALVRGRPQGDDPPGHRRQQHRPDEAPPRTRLLRPPSPRRRNARHGAAERRSLTAHAGCLSRVPRRVASTVLRRGAPENGAPYPTTVFTGSATSPIWKTSPWSGPGTGPASWRRCAAWRSACYGWTAMTTSPPPTVTTLAIPDGR